MGLGCGGCEISNNFKKITMKNLRYNFKIRQANSYDINTLAKIRHSVVIHKDRVRDADGKTVFYAIIENKGEIIGFGLLVFERPCNWTDFEPGTNLPMMIDVFIKPACRNKGAGTHLIKWMETKVREMGEDSLYLEVDPLENSGAYRLYNRLGYRPLQDKPYRSHWRFTDSAGNVHEGKEWNIDMVKKFNN